MWQQVTKIASRPPDWVFCQFMLQSNFRSCMLFYGWDRTGTWEYTQFSSISASFKKIFNFHLMDSDSRPHACISLNNCIDFITDIPGGFRNYIWGEDEKAFSTFNLTAVKTRTWKESYSFHWHMFVLFAFVTHAFDLCFSELSLTQYFTHNP